MYFLCLLFSQVVKTGLYMCIMERCRRDYRGILHTERRILGDLRGWKELEGLRGTEVAESIWMDTEEAWSLVWTETRRYLDKHLGNL